MSSPLLKFTDDELDREIARRRNVREREQEPILFCDECRNFNSEGGACIKGHKLSFKIPEAVCDEYGYYRRVCADRNPKSND